MLCPDCKKPYFFLSESGKLDHAKCSKCGSEGSPTLPTYEDYHEEKYLSASYQRTPKTDPQMANILKHLNIQKTDHVLDLGCGVGDYTAEFAKLTDSVKGYDQSVAAAKKRCPEIEFQEHDLSQPLPEPDGSFQKLLSLNVIEHLQDWEGFVRECFRVLAPGGIIALTTFRRDFFLHNIHYDETHMFEWTTAEFRAFCSQYFQEIANYNDCSMFKYYPLNWLFCRFLHPEVTFIGKKA